MRRCHNRTSDRATICRDRGHANDRDDRDRGHANDRDDRDRVHAHVVA